MQSGELRHLLTVEHNVPVRMPSGQQRDDWKKFTAARFKIEGRAGTEGTRAQQIEATYTHVLTCRWFAGANSKMRLRHGDGRILEVESVNNQLEKNRWLVWLATEATDGR